MVENASACANGDFRSLTLSVEDDVRQLSGKRFGSIPSLERFEHDRWIDQYKNPGPFVCTPCARASSHSITQDGASTGRAGFVPALSSAPACSQCHAALEEMLFVHVRVPSLTHATTRADLAQGNTYRFGNRDRRTTSGSSPACSVERSQLCRHHLPSCISKVARSLVTPIGVALVPMR